MNKPKIKLITNVPCAMVLENPHGKETSSKFHDGVEYMYSVICQGEASVLFLPVDGTLAINRLQPRPGDEVEMLKTMRNNRVEYQARVISRDAEPPPPQRQQPAPYERQAGQPVRMLAPQSQIRSEPAPFPPSPAALAERPSPVNTVHPLEELMTRCLVVAGRSVWRAYVELTEAGCAFDKPMIEDVRALGITMYIERTREQNRGAR